MNKVIFPLEGGQEGSAVADLQDALQLFMDRGLLLQDDEGARRELSQLLKRERLRQTYRDATIKLVSIFQETRGLSPENFGAVDEITANDMNALLKELGELEERVQDQECQSAVGGQVLTAAGLPFTGGVVRLYHEPAPGAGGRGALRLGNDDTDGEGAYTIRYEPLPGTEKLNLYVTVSTAAGQLLARSETISGAKPIEVIDVRVPDEPPATYRVSGKVASRTTAAVAGLRVQIVDKGVGQDVPLAEAATSPDGAYLAEFDDGSLRQRAKSRPDLQAKVFSGERLLGISDIRYDASTREVLDIRLDEKAGAALQSEHETLTTALGGQFQGRLGELKENDEQQDITYLANKTGWDARAVALASLSDQFSTRATEAGEGLEPVWFYALFRAGVPANEQALYQTDMAAAQAAWKKAAAQGVIPAGLENEIPAATERFQKLAARHALDRPALAGVSSLKEMLNVSLGEDDARQTRFAELYTRHRADLPSFWEAVRGEFGEETEKRLRRDGKLAYLTLNNAALVSKLHTSGQAEISDPRELVERGFYRAETWQDLIGTDPVPPEITGSSHDERCRRYAELLAAQLRLSYPTAVVAHMVRTGETPLADEAAAEPVVEFLNKHESDFEIGMQPVERYAARHQIELAPEVTQAVARIQRVYQITPDDAAMNALLSQGVDSAFAVAGYDRDEFVRTFGEEMGGADQAALIHAKAQQVYNVTLNLAVSYISAKNAPAVGARNSPAAYIAPEPLSNGNALASDVIAYPTLEGLFGEFDFCDCEHCRSVLSPAAYLVDLLQFCHRPTNEKEDPQAVLFERRPDIQHLPLTCENTNIPLPYIDLVNETLEYYVTNNLTLANYTGHDTDPDATPAELLANPQYVSDNAYVTLAGKPIQAGDPDPLLPPTPPLPFHLPLETLRRYFDHFEAPLPQVMEALRLNDDLERPSADEYGWRDILMEELCLSRAEHALLTERGADLAATLRKLYGFAPTATEAELLTELANAKQYTRRVGLTYEELVEILRTRFINPHAALIPKLEKLGVSFATLKALHESAATGQGWLDLLPQPPPDAARYGGDIEAWVKDADNFANLMGLITLADPTGAGDECSFDNLEFRYSDPDENANRLRGSEYVTLIRFIRLWRKLGWTIDQTDKALAALYPPAQAPTDADQEVNLERLDNGFLTTLPRLGVVRRALKALNLKPQKDLLALLACFAPVDTHGAVSLYRQMFLSPALLKQDPAFADDGFGGFLTDPNQKLLAHSEALRAAFQMTEPELNEAALGFDANTALDLANISAVFRRGWLARKLKLSQREFRLLVEFTGIDPFALPEPPYPGILRFIRLVGRLRAAPLKPAQALYLLWNQDLRGKSAPEEEEIAVFARTLRSDFSGIEAAFARVDDPNGQIARARMALVYGNEAADAFFGLLDRKVVTDAAYAHAGPELEAPILAAAPGLGYDHLRKRLSYSAGALPDAQRDALLLVPGVTQSFKDAVAELHSKSRALFERYPELRAYHDDFLASVDPLEKRRSDLLEKFLPELKRRRKRQQALQALSALADVELGFAAALLEGQANGLHPLHAAGDSARPALDDLTALETPGLTAAFSLSDTIGDPPDQVVAAEPLLSYAPGSHPLPINGGNAVSGRWSGWLEAPENGFYNFLVEAEAGATVTLILADIPVALAQNGTVWSNTTPIELRAGALYAFTLVVEKVKDNLTVRWETTGRGREVLPARYLYPAAFGERLEAAYTRFFKAASLARALKLTDVELAHLATQADTLVGGQSWLNSLPASGDPSAADAVALLAALEALLTFAGAKAKYSPGDERLLAALQDPAAAAQAPEGVLFTLTRWEPSSLDAVLTRFGLVNTDLASLDIFDRVAGALDWAQKLGVPAEALIEATGNEPDGAAARALQGVLRARYEESDWLKVLQPINDGLRAVQRDALVGYILHQMRQDPAQAHIDTPEKLFEFFLMDVQMEPCMQTSRIRHALSSVQLFIERCTMNLEPRVSPASIIARQWQWMSRYRVWEANRKVFLWPENWLEPELRDDQSPFFKETMGELLQSDITEERAAIALLNYLARLDEVAKLEVCGVHYEEKDPTSADDIIHVVARTAGANRKYFYRRRDPSGWMAWEQIKLDIEDNPVIPLVWNNRLFVFWLKILQQAPLDVNQMSTSAATGSKGLGSITLGEVKSDAKSTAKANTKITYQAVLCWSEFYNGKWQPSRTSDVNRPLDLGQYDPVGPNAFDRDKWKLAALFFTKGALRLIVTDGNLGTSFFLHNAFSNPELRSGKKETHFPFKRSSETSTQAFKLNYTSANLGHTVLLNSIVDRTIEPNHSTTGEPWDAPFFYEDGRHVFYVTTHQTEVTVPYYEDYGIVVVPPSLAAEIPPLVFEAGPKVPDLAGPVIRQPGFGVVDTSPMERYVTEDAYIRRGLGTDGTVTFNGREIGPAGSQVKHVRAR